MTNIQETNFSLRSWDDGGINLLSNGIPFWAQYLPRLGTGAAFHLHLDTQGLSLAEAHLLEHYLSLGFSKKYGESFFESADLKPGLTTSLRTFPGAIALTVLASRDTLIQFLRFFWDLVSNANSTEEAFEREREVVLLELEERCPHRGSFWEESANCPYERILKACSIVNDPNRIRAALFLGKEHTIHPTAYTRSIMDIFSAIPRPCRESTPLTLPEPLNDHCVVTGRTSSCLTFPISYPYGPNQGSLEANLSAQAFTSLLKVFFQQTQIAEKVNVFIVPQKKDLTQLLIHLPLANNGTITNQARDLSKIIRLLWVCLYQSKNDGDLLKRCQEHLKKRLRNKHWASAPLCNLFSLEGFFRSLDRHLLYGPSTYPADCWAAMIKLLEQSTPLKWPEKGRALLKKALTSGTLHLFCRGEEIKFLSPSKTLLESGKAGARTASRNFYPHRNELPIERIETSPQEDQPQSLLFPLRGENGVVLPQSLLSFFVPLMKRESKRCLGTKAPKFTLGPEGLLLTFQPPKSPDSFIRNLNEIARNYLMGDYFQTGLQEYLRQWEGPYAQNSIKRGVAELRNMLTISQETPSLKPSVEEVLQAREAFLSFLSWENSLGLEHKQAKRSFDLGPEISLNGGIAEKTLVNLSHSYLCQVHFGFISPHVAEWQDEVYSRMVVSLMRMALLGSLRHEASPHQAQIYSCHSGFECASQTQNFFYFSFLCKPDEAQELKERALHTLRNLSKDSSFLNWAPELRYDALAQSGISFPQRLLRGLHEDPSSDVYKDWMTSFNRDLLIEVLKNLLNFESLSVLTCTG